MGSIPVTTKQTPFRQYLPDLTTPRFQKAKQQSAYEYVDTFRAHKHPPWLYDLTSAWEELLKEPFGGVTVDGKIQTGVFAEQKTDLAIDDICYAVTRVLSTASPDELTKLRYPLNAREWRCWSNPEFLLRPFGLRLEEVSKELAQLILGVLQATLSPEGYQKALGAMRVNHFLGKLVELPKIMNEFSYNLLIFGEPSITEAWGRLLPFVRILVVLNQLLAQFTSSSDYLTDILEHVADLWVAGWSFYGHHLCISVFLKGGHISISPTFTGAEPNLIDDGEYAGVELLHREGELGLQLMTSLSSDLQKQAQIYELLHDPKMLQTGDLKVDRWNHDDQRHLCGAFRDNRVVPYEGIIVGELTSEQQQVVLQIVEQFVLYLPAEARRLRLTEVERHFVSTYFSWIGKYGADDAYYFRIQSPVIVCEFDHHSGVFLNNEEPAKFHIHTLVRTPNGGDYGNVFRSQAEKVP